MGLLPDVEFKTSIDLNIVNKLQTLNPFWISGFAIGEGSFTYFTRKTSEGKSRKDYTFVF